MPPPIDPGRIERMVEVVEGRVSDENHTIEIERQRQRSTEQKYQFFRDPFGLEKRDNRTPKQKQRCGYQHDDDGSEEQRVPECLPHAVTLRRAEVLPNDRTDRTRQREKHAEGNWRHPRDDSHSRHRRLAELGHRPGDIGLPDWRGELRQDGGRCDGRDRRQIGG